MKVKLSFLLFLTISISIAQDNLINSSTWVEGRSTANIAQFSPRGGADENIIENGENPFGEISPLWRVMPNTTTPSWRGFNTDNFDNFTIDINEDYRFSMWVKIVNDEGGRFISLLRGTGSPVYKFSTFDNTSTFRDTYFRSGGNMPENDKWFLMVGYVSGVNGTVLYNDSGFHDLQGNVTPLGTNQMRFNSTMDVQFTVINDLYNRTNAGYNVVGNSQNLLYFDPRFEKVNGAPSISELINNAPPGGSGLWTSNSSGVHYNEGNVGIGTTDPGQEWKLAVNGKIRSKEIKVETDWSDYVFFDDYKLPTLQEVEQHIQEKGHLINIPSATEVEANGIELGEMNKLLLEKIEELTLYILKQDSEIKILKQQMLSIQKKINNP